MDSLPDKNFMEQSFHAEAVMPLIQERLAAGQRVRNLSFSGTSMLPMLRQGKDCVDLAPLPERLRKYDLPVYRIPNGKYVIHRVVDVRDNLHICLGDNTYTYEKVARDQMIAIVSAFTRSGKRISVENRGYRLYCWFWCAISPIRRFMKLAKWRMKAAAKQLLRKKNKN